MVKLFSPAAESELEPWSNLFVETYGHVCTLTCTCVYIKHRYYLNGPSSVDWVFTFEAQQLKCHWRARKSEFSEKSSNTNEWRMLEFDGSALRISVICYCLYLWQELKKSCSNFTNLSAEASDPGGVGLYWQEIELLYKLG